MDARIPPQVSQWFRDQLQDCEAIGDVIRQLREDRDLTQRELGKRVFMSDKTISRIENGQQALREFNELVPFISAFGCTSEERVRLVRSLFCMNIDVLFSGKHEEVLKWLSQQKRS